MKRLIIAAALALASASALAVPPLCADPPVYPCVQLGAPPQLITPPDPFGGQPARPRSQAISIDADGNVVFSRGATIDFTGVYSPVAGPRRGYVLVYVNGEPVLLQLFALPGCATGAHCGVQP